MSNPDPITKRAALISTFGATGVTIALAMITSVVLARYLGPEGRGALLVLTFWPALLAGLSNLSVNEAATYHIARAIRAKGYESGDRYAGSALWLQVFISVAATVCILSALPFLLPSSKGESLGMVLLYAALFTPLLFLDLHFKSVLQGRGAFGALNIIRLCQPFTYAIALVFLVLTGWLEVRTVMAAMLLALGASFVAGASLSGWHVFAADFSAARETLLTGWKFHLANIVLFTGTEADKFIILQFMDDKNIGYYAVAIALSGLGTRFVVKSFVLVLTREMSAAVTKDEQRVLLLRYAHDAGLLLILFNGVIAALTPLWLPLLYGSGFEPAVPVAMILFVMSTLKGLRQIVDRAIRATRKTGVGMISEMVGLAGILIFAPIGVGIAGLQGLAWGIVVAQTAALAVIVIGAARSLGFDPVDISPFRKVVITRLLAVAWRELRAAWGWWRGQ